MGGRFSRKKKTPTFPPGPSYGGPMYPPTGYSYPQPYPYGPGPDPMTGFGEYDPYDVYGYGPEPGPTESLRGMPPWNYGNYYLGNTTLQMLPLMQRKLAKFSMMQGLGGGMMPGLGGGMMPMMPMMPCLPACSMPCLPSCGTPMMAAACPLPIASNPLIQNMYSPTSMNSMSFMSPSSFMSSLSACSPAGSFQFPNNVGMVMTLPSSAPNPLLSASAFGGFCPQYNPCGGMTCCCCFCTSTPAPPPITYYPRPVSVPQPYPVPCPSPVPIPNVQQVPVPRYVSVVAPPIVADCNSASAIPSGAPLMPSQGGFTQTGFGQPAVMKSNNLLTKEILLSNKNLKDRNGKRPLYKPSTTDRREKAQRIAASLSLLGLNDNLHNPKVSNGSKQRIRSTHTNYKRSFDKVSALPLYKSHTDDLTLDHLSLMLNKSKYNQVRRHRNS